MAPSLSLADVPADFVEITKAIYGDAADPRELWDVSKMNDASEMHVNSADERKRKTVAAGLVLGSAAESDGTVTAFRNARAKLAQPKVPAITGLKGPRVTNLRGIARKATALSETKGGSVARAGVQAANLAVGLTAAHELTKKPKQPVAKAFRVKPLNVNARQVPSLKARRPVAPPVSKSLTWVGDISKVDEDKRQVFGWASLSEINGQVVTDRQGDIIPLEEIEKSAYTYVIESRTGGDMHSRVAKGLQTEWTQPLHTSDMIESFVVTPEKLEKMGLPSDALPLGWWVGFQVNDETQWQMVKSGERAGFSIHGTGSRTPVAKADATPKLRERVEAAVKPPAVQLKPVSSTAVKAMGYQRQTRRLSYEMRSRPGKPYNYRLKPVEAQRAVDAESIGSHYSREVRGKAPRANRVRVSDRARLFADPPKRQVNKSAAAQVIDTAGDVGVLAGRLDGSKPSTASTAPPPKRRGLRPLLRATPPPPVPLAVPLPTPVAQ